MPKGFYRDLTEILRRHGCEYLRPAKGDHELWFSPINGARFVADKTCKSRHTANGVLKQAGIEAKL